MVSSVSFKRDLDKVKSKRSKDRGKQRKRTDIMVDAYCKEHPLSLPSGVNVHRVFMDKGEPMHPAMAKLFSPGLPQKGVTSLKSIMYGHVLMPHTGMNRTENFSHLSDESIFTLKDEIVSMVEDPFWKSIEDRQKMGAFTWNGYGSLVDNINAQYSTHGKTIDDVPWWVIAGIRAAVAELPDDISPISLEESIAYCRTDTNAGFPTFTSKPFISVNDDGMSYTVLDDEVYSTYSHIAKEVWNGRAHTNLPAALFKRVQPGHGMDSKKRIVECVSRGILWAEARIWRPILEAMRDLEPYSGYMHYSHGLNQAIGKALEMPHVSSLDYSGYDASIGQFLPILFGALAEKIPLAAPIFEWSARYYRSCPLITPHGMILGEHGLFSGMFGTSFGGSLINRGLVLGMEMAFNSEGMSMGRHVHLAFGDDTVLAWDGSVEIHDIIKVLGDAGMLLNIDKQEYCGVGHSDKFVMFQACYWRHNPGAGDHCVPVYPLVRMATRLAFIEYMDANSKIVYGAGKRINDIECTTVVGPIIGAFISKLSESSHHPYIENFISRYQETWVHYLNPLECVTNERVLAFVNRYLGYVESTSVNEFLTQPVCEFLLLNMERIDTERASERVIFTKDELIRVMSTRRSNIVHSVTTHSDPPGEDLMESIMNSGLGEGLVNSILLRLPSEVL